MRGVLICKKTDCLVFDIKKLDFSKVIMLKTPDEVERFQFKDNDLVISAIEDSEKAIKLEERLNNKYSLICLYFNTIHYPFEQYSNTIFIPSDSTEETIMEAIVRLGYSSARIKNETLVGSSRIMDKVRFLIDKYAKLPYSIHLSGNTGTGKNIAAKLIHAKSNLKNSMVYVNCGSCKNIGLIESNFFGHAKGSFTGSSNSRNGYLRNADKSTLFLDEIENMSHQLQEILLDTIDSGKFRSVGSDTETNSDFRIITASNIELDKLVSTGKLRKDFYYRIAEREIHMPDLKDHKEDIPELVQYYERVHSIIRHRITDYSPLFRSDWPGNIRELFKAISLMHEEIEDRNTYYGFTLAH